MPRHASPARHARDRAAALSDVASRWQARPVLRRKKALVLAGTALALASASSAAATAPGDPPAGARQARLTADLRPPAAQPATQRPAGRSPARQPVPLRAVPVTWKQRREVVSGQSGPAPRQRALPVADAFLAALQRYQAENQAASLVKQIAIGR